MILKTSSIGLAGALFLRQIRTESRLRWLVTTVLAVGLLSAAVGIAVKVGVFSLGLASLSSEVSFGQFPNRNHFALLMEMTIGLALGIAAVGAEGRAIKMIYLAVASLPWLALVLTTSRGGIAGMIGLSAFVLFFAARTGRHDSTSRNDSRIAHLAPSLKSFRRVSMATLLLIAITAGVVWIGGSALRVRLERLPGEFGSADDITRANGTRMDIWRATARMIREHPFAGVGFNAYAGSITKYHDASGVWVPREAHNEYLEVAASGGVIGLALLGWFIVVVCRRVARTFRNSTSFRRGAAVGAVAGMIGVALHSFVDFGLHVTINALVFVSLVAIATTGIAPQRTASRRTIWSQSLAG